MLISLLLSFPLATAGAEDKGLTSMVELSCLDVIQVAAQNNREINLRIDRLNTSFSKLHKRLKIEEKKSDSAPIFMFGDQEVNKIIHEELKALGEELTNSASNPEKYYVASIQSIKTIEAAVAKADKDFYQKCRTTFTQAIQSCIQHKQSDTLFRKCMDEVRVKEPFYSAGMNLLGRAFSGKAWSAKLDSIGKSKSR